MIYRPPTLKAQETPFSCELDALERHTNGGFRERSIFFRGQRDTPAQYHSALSPDAGSIPTFAIIPSVVRIGAWQKRKDKIMNNAKYKVAITEIAAKTAAKKYGGAAARYWGVIIIDKETGEKRTAADMLNAAAKKAAAAHDEEGAAAVRHCTTIYGGAYRRETEAIVAADAYAYMHGGDLAASIAARLEEARRVEAEYTAEEERRRAERKARRLAAMSDAEKAAAARREEIRAIRADAKRRISEINAAAAAA